MCILTKTTETSQNKGLKLEKINSSVIESKYKPNKMSKSKSSSDSKGIIGSLKSLVLRQSTSSKETKEKTKDDIAAASKSKRLSTSPMRGESSDDSPNNIVVFNDVSMTGKKAPRFLLKSKPGYETNTNNHAKDKAERKEIVKPDAVFERAAMGDGAMPVVKPGPHNVDTLSETSSDFPNQNESSCYGSGASDSEEILSTDQSFNTVQGCPARRSSGEQPTTTAAAKGKKPRDVAPAPKPQRKSTAQTPSEYTSDSDPDSGSSESSSDDDNDDDASAVNVDAKNEMSDICRQFQEQLQTAQQDLESAHQDIHYLRATLARDVHIAYQAGFDRAREASDSDLKSKISQQMTMIRELNDKNNSLETLLARREKDAFAVNERVLKEYSTVRETLNDVLQKSDETPEAETAPAATATTETDVLTPSAKQQLLKAYDVNTKALATCVELQSTINEQRLVITAQHLQLKQASVFRKEIDADDIMNFSSSSESTTSSSSSDDDDASASADEQDKGDVSKQVADTVEDMLFSRDGATGEPALDAQQLIVNNFELGADPQDQQEKQ